MIIKKEKKELSQYDILSRDKHDFDPKSLRRDFPSTENLPIFR